MESDGSSNVGNDVDNDGSGDEAKPLLPGGSSIAHFAPMGSTHFCWFMTSTCNLTKDNGRRANV
jgi:hypothetical protein